MKNVAVVPSTDNAVAEAFSDFLSAEEIKKAISQPLALVQGQFPKKIVTPTAVPQSYLDIVSMLKLPPLLTNMSLTKFRSATKLDLKENTF